MKTMDIVIPVFNESACIAETVKRLLSVVESLKDSFSVRLIFVDDGSRDDTFLQLQIMSKVNSVVKVIKLSRNFGHQIALTAGLDYAKADIIAIIDGDLQDPPELIPEMAKKILEGYHVVYGQRLTRDGETLFKLISAAVFYRLLSRMCDVEIPKDTGDFRLMSSKAHSALQSMRERHRFVRGMVPFIGFKTYAFEYERKARFAGETKYPLKKMINFAMDAILSFSIKPIKIMRYVGIAALVMSLALLSFILYKRIFGEGIIPGFTVLMIVIIFFGGLQILFMSLLGEYVGRIFEEIKGRPLYFIDEILNND